MPDDPPIGQEKRVELLHDHYKDTFQHVLEHWKMRNRLFAAILVVLALLLFQFTSPNVLEALANSYIIEQVKHERPAGGVLVDFRFITTVLWFILAYLLVQYYQRSILVERLYIYVARTERRISRHLGPGFVSRESEFYQEARPTFLKSVALLYRWVFAALLLAVVLAKIFQEWFSPEVRAGGWSALGFTVADTLIALVILSYSFLYFKWPFQQKPSDVPPEEAAEGADARQATAATPGEAGG